MLFLLDRKNTEGSVNELSQSVLSRFVDSNFDISEYDHWCNSVFFSVILSQITCFIILLHLSRGLPLLWSLNLKIVARGNGQKLLKFPFFVMYFYIFNVLTNRWYCVWVCVREGEREREREREWPPAVWDAEIPPLIQLCLLGQERMSTQPDSLGNCQCKLNFWVTWTQNKASQA